MMKQKYLLYNLIFIADLQKYDKRYNVISMVTVGARDKTTEDQPRTFNLTFTPFLTCFFFLFKDQK